MYTNTQSPNILMFHDAESDVIIALHQHWKYCRWISFTKSVSLFWYSIGKWWVKMISYYALHITLWNRFNCTHSSTHRSFFPHVFPMCHENNIRNTLRITMPLTNLHFQQQTSAAIYYDDQQMHHIVFTQLHDTEILKTPTRCHWQVHTSNELEKDTSNHTQTTFAYFRNPNQWLDSLRLLLIT